jgi:hypothetical protein
MSGARRARKRATQHIMTASGDDKEETSVLNQGTRFKALKSKNVTGYQALEREQEPAPRFPGTLASYVLVFPMDDEWIAWTNGEEPESVSYALLTAQPLMDKMRSSDMIVRVFTDDAQKRCYALVSISEKRQKMVAQIMSSLIRLRLKRQDDEDNYIKNGGAWSDFKQHLAALYERSSEGTLFSSCQQCQIIEFLLNDVDERALGPQLMQKVRIEPLSPPLRAKDSAMRAGRVRVRQHHPGAAEKGREDHGLLLHAPCRQAVFYPPAMRMRMLACSCSHAHENPESSGAHAAQNDIWSRQWYGALNDVLSRQQYLRTGSKEDRKGG